MPVFDDRHPRTIFICLWAKLPLRNHVHIDIYIGLFDLTTTLPLNNMIHQYIVHKG